MLTAYLAQQVLTYMYTYTCWVSSKHLVSAYCLPLLVSAYVYVYVYLHVNMLTAYVYCLRKRLLLIFALNTHIVALCRRS